MELKTTVEIPKYNFEINHNDKCLFIGSCFSDNIGEKVLKSKIPTQSNPTGIHYNPFSIANTLEKICNKTKITESEIFFANGVWNHYNFHGRFSKTTAEETVKIINSAIESTYNFLQSTDYLFITFGTAFVFELKNTNAIVSNCHKQSSENFLHKMLSPAQIVERWNLLIDDLYKFNPDLKIIFTVSPVRHIKNGAIENMRSKAGLILAIKELCEKNKYNNLYYFPVYEIVNDELRDYRFYAEDMQHISNIAIEYIWGKFKESFFSKKTLEFIKDVQALNKALEHRPFNRDTVLFKNFCCMQIDKIRKLEKIYEISLQEEKEYFYSFG